MQFSLPSAHVAMGVFQNLMVSKYVPGASAWYCAQEPGWSFSISAQALVLTGVSPKESACSAWTRGVLTQAVHRYAQFGCGALVASIQVSPQPVAPSGGIVSANRPPLPFNGLVWPGHS